MDRFEPNLRIPGPTALPPSVREAGARQMINHRGPEFAATAHSNGCEHGSPASSGYRSHELSRGSEKSSRTPGRVGGPGRTRAPVTVAAGRGPRKSLVAPLSIPAAQRGHTRATASACPPVSGCTSAPGHVREPDEPAAVQTQPADRLVRAAAPGVHLTCGPRTPSGSVHVPVAVTSAADIVARTGQTPSKQAAAGSQTPSQRRTRPRIPRAAGASRDDPHGDVGDVPAGRGVEIDARTWSVGSGSTAPHVDRPRRGSVRLCLLLSGVEPMAMLRRSRRRDEMTDTAQALVRLDPGDAAVVGGLDHATGS